MYRLTIVEEQEPQDEQKPEGGGKRRRRQKPTTRTVLQLELTDVEEYLAARKALLGAMK